MYALIKEEVTSLSERKMVGLHLLRKYEWLMRKELLRNLLCWEPREQVGECAWGATTKCLVPTWLVCLAWSNKVCRPKTNVILKPTLYVGFRIALVLGRQTLCDWWCWAMACSQLWIRSRALNSTTSFCTMLVALWRQTFCFSFFNLCLLASSTIKTLDFTLTKLTNVVGEGG